MPNIDETSSRAETAADSAFAPLRVCVIGLGGGGFHWEAQRIIQSVKRPLELVLVYAGPGGGLIYWNSKDVIRSSFVVRSPSLTGDTIASRVGGTIQNLWQAFNILYHEKPDVVLAAGTAQAIPFAVVGRLIGIPVWFVESVTRSLRPSRTGALLHWLRVGRVYFYWSGLAPYLRRGIRTEAGR